MRIAVEYGELGDLLSYLRLKRETNNPYFREVQPESMISASKLLKFAKDIADGMDYISSQNVSQMFPNFITFNFMTWMVVGQYCDSGVLNCAVRFAIGPGGGGYSHIVWVGVCCWVRESPTLY